MLTDAQHLPKSVIDCVVVILPCDWAHGIVRGCAWPCLQAQQAQEEKLRRDLSSACARADRADMRAVNYQAAKTRIGDLEGDSNCMPANSSLIRKA